MLTAAPHPFKVGHEIIEVPEGLTLAEMLAICQSDPYLARHAVAMINGEIILREVWRVVRPKAGTHVEIRVLPTGGGGGGGKNVLRVLLTIAVIVAASLLGGPLGTTLGISAFAGSAIISAVGILLINVLVPLRPPSFKSFEQPEPSFSITGSRNRFTPFEPVPQPLGRHRMAPPYGALPFTEIIGEDQFLRMIFVWGIGPLDIDTSSLKIGETPLADFEGVETEHREGQSGDSALTLYSDTVSQSDINIEMTFAVGFLQRTSAVNADELSVDMVFPLGFINIHNDGSTDPISVTIEIEYRKVGDVPWLTPSFTAKTFPDAWVVGNTITFTDETRKPVRHGMRWPVSPNGQYEVRTRRTTADNNDPDDINDIFWSILRTITDKDPINSPVPVAKTALRIKATNQLNRVIDEFNGIVTTRGLDWNGSSWDSNQKITNPASLFRHVLQGKAIAAPVVDARLDLPSIQAWHLFNSTRSFKFNQVRFSQASVWETLQDVAGAGRAAPAQIDGKWSVLIEDVRATPVSHITPRNSFGFTAEKTFIDKPHGWRINFPNEDQGFRADERRVFRDGFTKSNATKFESLVFPGVTDPEQIQKLGRFRIAQFENQPERWSFRQDLEFITYQRGDRVAITHEVLLVGDKSGRIKSVTIDGGTNVTAVNIDEQIIMAAGKSYGIAIRTVDDASILRGVTTVEGPTRDLTLSTSIPPVSGNPAVAKGDLFGFGETGLETDDATIISIAPDNDFRARIIAVPYRPAIFDIDGELIPPFVTNLTPLPVIPAPVIQSVVSDESAIILGPGQSLQTRVIVTFTPLNDPLLNNPTVLIQSRSSAGGEPFKGVQLQEQSSSHVVFGGVLDGQTIDIRLRFEIEGRLPGPFITVFNHTVVGKGTAPSGLTGLTIGTFGGQAFLRWDAPDEIDVAFGGTVQFRHSALLVGALWEASASIGTAAQARDLIAGLPLKPGTYLARVFDAAGNPSVAIASVTTKQASVLLFGNAASIDEDPSFAGTHIGTLVDSGTLKLDGIALWDSFVDFDLVADIDSAGGVSPSGTYEFLLGFDLATVTRVRLTSRITVLSTNVNDLMDDWDELLDDREDFDGIVQAAGDVRVEVHHTDNDPAGSPTWTAYERLDSAEFEARGFDFRAILTTSDPSFNPFVTDLGIDKAEVV